MGIDVHLHAVLLTCDTLKQGLWIRRAELPLRASQRADSFLQPEIQW